MAVCKTCKCEPKSCGCADKAVAVAPFCGDFSCPDPEPCAETFSAECIVYTGNDIPQLGIMKGDRVDHIIQLMSTYLLNQSCIEPFSDFDNQVASTCLAVLGLEASNISTTSLTLSWNAPDIISGSVDSYTISFSVVPDPGDPIVWTTVTGLDSTSYNLTGLVDGTSYYFMVTTVCDSGGPCNSIVIQATTLNA